VLSNETQTDPSSFYNGHLSETRRRLEALDKPETASKAAAVRYPSAKIRLQEIQQDYHSDSDSDKSSNSVGGLRDDLAMELTSPLGRVTYPDNLTWSNFVDFVFCPTLCYELEYPRTDGIVWSELFYKTLAVFGCIFLLTVTSEEFIIPVLADAAVRMHGPPMPKPTERALVLAETISRLLFPFMVSFLLVFLVIFEYLLGAFAEMSCKPQPTIIPHPALTKPTIIPRPALTKPGSHQASPTGTSTPTGGTAATGSSSAASGTSPCTTSSAATCTAPRAAT
jgi:sterol O-acyltransferase